MLNNSHLIIILVVIIEGLLILGCETTEVNQRPQETKQTKALGKDYFKMLFTVKNYTELSYNKNRKNMSDNQASLKPFLTEKGYEKVYGDGSVRLIGDNTMTTQTNIDLKM